MNGSPGKAFGGPGGMLMGDFGGKKCEPRQTVPAQWPHAGARSARRERAIALAPPARWPPLPSGALSPRLRPHAPFSPAPPAASARWAAAERHISVGQMLVGAAMLLLSVRYLYQFTETTGLFLGGLLLACGAVGYVGGSRRNANLVNLQLVASIVGILLAFQFVGEVVRDAQVGGGSARARGPSSRAEGYAREQRQRSTHRRMWCGHTRQPPINRLINQIDQSPSQSARHSPRLHGPTCALACACHGI